MNELEYKKLWKFEKYYWWFIARRRLVRALVHKYVERSGPTGSYLDLGCGTGNILNEIGRAFKTALGMDLSPSALRLTRTSVSFPLVCADACKLPFVDNSFDLISCLDVLEHTRGDIDCIRECFRVCKLGGHVVFSVPAFDFLWSEHDEALHHLRRYSWRNLKAKLEAAGFRVVKATYAVCALFVPILLVRFISAFRRSRIQPETMLLEIPPWMNRLLIALHDVENALSLSIGLPFGTALVGIARKDKDTNNSARHRHSVRKQ